jgi:hypothetical protein
MSPQNPEVSNQSNQTYEEQHFENKGCSRFIPEPLRILLYGLLAGYFIGSDKNHYDNG